MAEASGGFVIPTITNLDDFKKFIAKRTEEEIALLSEQKDLLSNWAAAFATNKKQEDALKKSQEALFKNMSGLVNQKTIEQAGIVPKKDKKLDKIKEKILFYWNKNIIGKKWFEVAGKAFKDIGMHLKNLAKAGGSILLDLLKFFLLMSIFDPDGTLVMSIIDFLLGIGLMLIGILEKMMPRFINILMTVAPKIATAVWNAILTLGKALGDALAKTLQDIFGFTLPVGPVTDFLKQLVGVGAVLGLLILKFPILQTLLGGVGKLLWSVISSLASSLMGVLFPPLVATEGAAIAAGGGMMAMLGPILLVVLGIAALIAVLVLIWNYADEIIGFFEGIFDWFSKLSTGAKILVGALALIFFPITAVAGLIYGLAKLFSWLKTTGEDGTSGLDKVIAVIKELWETIKAWFIDIYNHFGEIMTAIVEGITDAIIMILKIIFWPVTLGMYIYENFEMLKTSIIGIFTSLVDSVMGILRTMKNNFIRNLKMIFGLYRKYFIDPIWNLVKAIGSAVMSKLGPFEKLFDTIKSVIGKIVDTVQNINLDSIGKFFSSLWQNIKSFFAKVQGYASTIFSSQGAALLLTPGEAATQKFDLLVKANTLIAQGGEQAKTGEIIKRAIEQDSSIRAAGGIAQSNMLGSADVDIGDASVEQLKVLNKRMEDLMSKSVSNTQAGQNAQAQYFGYQGNASAAQTSGQ